MRATAARLVRHGEPLVVQEIDLPEPGEGECLVQLGFAGVNPVDRYQVLGRVAKDAPLPRTLGSEASGWLLSGDGSKKEPVFVNKSALVRPDDGLWASHGLVRSSAAIPVPPGVDPDVVAAMGVAGVTAWRCAVEIGATTEADQVLVLGASGGVGSILVSIAHRRGCYVVAQTGSKDKVRFLEDRGADRVVVADAATLAAELGAFSPTVAFDPLGGGFTGAAIEQMAERGRLVLFGTSADPSGTIPLQALYRKALRVIGYAGLIEPPERILDAVRDGLGAVSQGAMEIVIGARVSLADVNEGLEQLANRAVEGKLVLDLRA